MFVTYLQHPVTDNLPHVWLEFCLHCLEIALGSNTIEVVLTVQDVGQDPLVLEQDRVLVGPGVDQHNVVIAGLLLLLRRGASGKVGVVGEVLGAAQEKHVLHGGGDANNRFTKLFDKKPRR